MKTQSSDFRLLLILIRRRQKKRVHRYWVHPLNLLRPSMGEHLKLEMMYSSHPKEFFDYTRLSPSQFDKVIEYTGEKLQKLNTTFRKAIPPRVRLLVTLRYLTTGDAMKTIATNFSLGRKTVQDIVWETTAAIWESLYLLYMKPPSTQEWETIIDDYEALWNFPNCFGAIDGKHIVIQAPPNSGSLNFNYKGSFSIVLLAACDARYRFTMVDIGAHGRQSDGGIFSNSSFGRMLSEGSLPIPAERHIKNSDLVQPCTLVGDDAFSLSTEMMRPYPGKYATVNKKRIFNYRLCRARRVIENVFGILCSRFRIFRRCIVASPEHAELIVKATCVLHNFLRSEEMKLTEQERLYCPPGLIDEDDLENGSWRSEGPFAAFQDVTSLGSNNYSKNAKQMRDNLADYFVTSGRVDWQFERAALSYSE